MNTPTPQALSEAQMAEAIEAAKPWAGSGGGQLGNICQGLLQSRAEVERLRDIQSSIQDWIKWADTYRDELRDSVSADKINAACNIMQEKEKKMRELLRNQLPATPAQDNQQKEVK